MKAILTCALLLFSAAILFGQKTASTKKPGTAKAVTPKPVSGPVDEKSRFEQAIAAASASERISALKKFAAEFPNSEFKARSAESLVVARAALGDEKLAAGEAAEGVALFKLAVEEAPQPIPDRLFAEVVSKFPVNLFFRGQREAAFELASLIEKKAEGNTFQLLALASFCIGVENGDEAKRLAEAAIKTEPSSSAYQTLALAHRLNFNLEESANAYAKALELDPGSVAAKRSLAEMKRALGKPDEAAALYREILAKSETDVSARSGLILSLFAAGKKAEAEAEMTKSTEKIPANVQLLAGAAYWYAANGDGAKAVELAEKAIAAEPRFIWSHIALARGLTRSGKPTEAERVLVAARKYGNFPTLEYEIASARLAAGFYRDAAEEMQKSFTVRDGLIQTRLGGRVAREDKSLADLIAFERKASIFVPVSTGDSESAAKLKALLEFNNKLGAATPDETAVAAAADEFVAGDDKMKLHRQLYAADALLQKKIALPKVIELTRSALGNTDAALDVAAPAAAVLASELYESRSIAFSRGEMLLVPDVPKQTLSAILRGRVEELAGWTLFQQGTPADAVVRLRRAVSIYPDKSAWWRSGMWRLGTVLEAEGKDKEALDSYVAAYKADKPDVLKYGAVEALYKKVNGSVDGLEAQIGSNPLTALTVQTPAKTTEAPAEPIVVPETKQEQAPVVVAKENDAPQKVETPVSFPKTLPIQTAETVADPVKTAATSVDSAKEVPTEKKAEESALPVANKEVPVEKKTEEIVAPAESKEVPVESKAEEIAPPVENKEVVAEKPLEVTKEAIPETIKTDNEPPAEKKTEPAVVTETSPEPISTEKKVVEKDVPIDKIDEKPPDPPADSEKPPPVAKKTATRKPPPKRVAKADPPLTAKPLFEPVIITVSKAEPIVLKTVTDGAYRPRVVDGKEISVEGTPPCSILTSRETVAVLKNGGSLGILVEVQPESAVRQLKALSSSRKDVEVVLKSEGGGLPGRRFFMIKSISGSTGVYQVTFDAMCGKKEIVVNVR